MSIGTELKELFLELQSKDENITPALVCNKARLSKGTLYNIFRGQKVLSTTLDRVRDVLTDLRESKSKSSA